VCWSCSIIEFLVFLLSYAYLPQELKPLKHLNKAEIVAALKELSHRKLRVLLEY